MAALHILGAGTPTRRSARERGIADIAASYSGEIVFTEEFMHIDL